MCTITPRRSLGRISRKKTVTSGTETGIEIAVEICDLTEIRPGNDEVKAEIVNNFLCQRAIAPTQDNFPMLELAVVLLQQSLEIERTRRNPPFALRCLHQY